MIGSSTSSRRSSLNPGTISCVLRNGSSVYAAVVLAVIKYWPNLPKPAREPRSKTATPSLSHLFSAPARAAATSGPTRTQCHSGFKLFPRQSIPPQAAARLATTCIIYRRQNVTAQYLSLKRALRNGCWGTRPEEQRSCSPRGPDARLGNDFAGFRRAYWTWYRDVEQACAGRKTLHWTTEGYLTQVRSVLELAGLV